MYRGQFIERQTVTLGPIATGRRAAAFESEMKKDWGGKVSRVRERMKVIRKLRERVEAGGWGGGVGWGGRKRINKSDRPHVFRWAIFLQT